MISEISNFLFEAHWRGLARIGPLRRIFKLFDTIQVKINNLDGKFNEATVF